MNKITQFVLVLLLGALTFSAHAKSTLELGAGVFTATLPHYPGADQHKTYILPTPYIYYASDEFKIDRNQFTGFMWNNDNWHLDISAGAGISINSDDNTARQDMPDLDWVFELGPSLKYFIDGKPSDTNRWFTEFFVRKAIATDFGSVDNVGWRYGASMAYQHQIYSEGKHHVMLSLRGTANFSDDKYLNYYYGVARQYKTQQRNTYSADTGYAGSDLSVGLTYKSPKYWVGGFVRYYALEGATQDDSPLFIKKNSVSAGLGFVWIFYNKTRD